MKSKKLLLLAFRLAVVAAFAVISTVPVAGQGARQQVQGTYFSAGTNVCLVAAPGAGFNANLTPTDGVSLQSSSVQGILKINADGTGTGQFKEFAITHPPATSAGASSNEHAVSFTYTIADDGTLTVVFSSVTGTLLTGPSVGLTFTVNPPPLTGRIGRDGKTMLLSNTDPTVETLHIIGGPSFQRICYRTRVLMPIHVDGED